MNELDIDIQSGGFRDGLTQAFTLVLFTEIADKTFFVACIMGRLLRALRSVIT